MGIRLALTITYNLERNDKSEHGQSPIIKTLITTCKGKIYDWPKLLPFVVYMDCITYSMVTRYMLEKLIYGQKLVILIEEVVPT